MIKFGDNNNNNVNEGLGTKVKKKNLPWRLEVGEKYSLIGVKVLFGWTFGFGFEIH